MEAFCPHCNTEMVSRGSVDVCPRHEIGECLYDGYQSQTRKEYEPALIQEHYHEEK